MVRTLRPSRGGARPEGGCLRFRTLRPIFEATSAFFRNKILPWRSTTLRAIGSRISSIHKAVQDASAIEDALSLKQSYLPNRIYKYRGINEHSLKALQTNQIWMASPDTFTNDPYDCSFKIVEEQAAAGFARSAFPVTPEPKKLRS